MQPSAPRRSATGAEVPTELDLKRLRRATSVWSDLGKLVYADVPLARQALRKRPAGPIECHPDGKLRGGTKVGPLFAAVDLAVASPRGFEPRLPP